MQIKKWQVATIILLSMPPLLALAADNSSSTVPDAVQMLQNLSSTYPALITLAKTFCYVFGVALAMRGVHYLKMYGDLRTMTSSNTSLKVPFIYFLTAAVMLFLPSTLETLNFTLFKEASPLTYKDIDSAIDPALLKSIVGLIYVVGLFAFIRGWMILVAIAQQSGGGQNSFGKGITHIVGGVLAMNIVGFTNVIWTTFGLHGIL